MKLLYYSFFCILLLSCTNNQYNENFEKRIPIDDFGNFDLKYQYTKEQIKYAKLNVIENGFDSICIRIWYASAVNQDQQIIEFSRKSNSKLWDGNYYYLALDTASIKLKYPNVYSEKIQNTGKYYYSLDTVQTMYKISKKAKLKEPNRGWNLFGKELLNTKITTAPDCNKICDYHIDYSNSSLLIEIGTKDYYRIFSYYSLYPDTNTKSIQKVVDLIKLIEDNFKIKLIIKV